MKSLELLRMMFDDVKRQWPEHKLSLDRDFKTIERRYQSEGFSFLAKTLPNLGDAIFASLEKGFFDCPFGFKRKGALPLLLGGLLEVCFDRRSGLLKNGDEVTLVLSDLRQLTFLFRKALATSRDERTLDELAKATFGDTDGDIPIGISDHMLQSVARYLWSPMEQSIEETLEPRNGPGGVAEGYSCNQKYHAILGSLDPQVATDYGWTFFETSYSQAEDLSAKTKRAAKLHSVPKNSCSRRTITVEPLTNMFCQQAWNTAIRAKISDDPRLYAAISLDDQRPSQEMARSSSHTKFYTTVDLSSASDRLSLALVEECFAHDQVLLTGLLRHRTPYVESDNVTWILRKYAGMGNATTFPIQSLVFTFLCVKAILVSRCLPVTSGNCYSALRLVRVYGDDIILPTYAYGALRQELTLVGLKVNERKSFTHSLFRESCGLDAYNGVDITPTYARQSLDDPWNPSSLQSFVATANQLWSRGFYSASNYIRGLVEKTLGPLPLVRRNSAGMGWTTRSDAFEPHRWNKDLHRWDQRLKCSSVKKHSDPLTGLPGLIKFFCEQSDSERNFESSVVRFQPRIRTRWCSA